MDRRLARAVASLDLTLPPPGPAVTDDDLADLPGVVARYLRAMGVVGHPAGVSFQAHLHGRFRLRGQGPWMPAEIWQYDAAAPHVVRVFHMRIDLAGVLPMVGEDTYVDGRGRMHGRLLDRVTVARAEGTETDLSELVTFLNDVVLLAPSMLLRLPVRYAAVADDAFDVTLVDAGRCVTARVLLDADGRPRDFTTTDRWADLPGGLVRARWTTPVGDWVPDDTDGRPRLLPRQAEAVWHLEGRELPYVRFALRPGDVRHDVRPRTRTAG